MTNVELLETLGRMCNERVACDNCSLYDGCAGCTESFEKKSDEAAKIIEQWAAEHPVKTRAMDFFEKFPNAPKNNDGTPGICLKRCGYPETECTLNGCKTCWDAPIEVEE